MERAFMTIYLTFQRLFKASEGAHWSSLMYSHLKYITVISFYFVWLKSVVLISKVWKLNVPTCHFISKHLWYRAHYILTSWLINSYSINPKFPVCFFIVHELLQGRFLSLCSWSMIETSIVLRVINSFSYPLHLYVHKCLRGQIIPNWPCSLPIALPYEFDVYGFMKPCLLL